MKTILVINGENYWQDYLPAHKVVRKTIQQCEWILRNNQLYAVDADGACCPDLILWRVGAIQPDPRQEIALRLIALSGVPCVNSATTLLRGYDRLSMLHALQQSGLPMLPTQFLSNYTQLRNATMPFPFVVKAGNYHGGFGKALVENEAQWQDIKDLLHISNSYISIEPYVAYERDIRYLAIGEHCWAMSRRGKFWKANVQTSDFVLMDLEAEWCQYTQQVQKMLSADMLALDILEDKEGNRFVVEYNDIPGISGFPEEAKEALAACVEQKLHSTSIG